MKTEIKKNKPIGKFIGFVLAFVMMLSVIGGVACATYWPEFYSVTFENADGSTFKKVTATSSTTKNSTMTWLAASSKPTYTNNTFVGWSQIDWLLGLGDPITLKYASGTAVTSKRTTTVRPTSGTLGANANCKSFWSHTWTVTYNANGENVTMPASKVYDTLTKSYSPYTTIEFKTDSPSNAYLSNGKHLAGWNTKADGSGTNTDSYGSITCGGNVTLYAQWEDAPITVYYQVNAKPEEVRLIGWLDSLTTRWATARTFFSQETTASAQSVFEEGGAVVPNGLALVEWNTKADGSGISYQPGDVIKPANAYPDGYDASTGNDPYITLYAQWKPATYKIIYDANDGDGAPETQTKDYNVDTRISSTTPTREGYVFSGWNNRKNGSGALSYTANQPYTRNNNIKLYAIWSPENGLDLKDCYKGCENMTTGTAVPESGFDMSSTYEDCKELTGELEINCNPSIVDDCFKNTVKPISLTGTIRENFCALLRGTANNNNVTCNHANVADAKTVLYDSGVFIINELPENRELNIARYGEVVKEYDPLAEEEWYQFEIETDVLWQKEASQIKNVKFGSAVQPETMKLWFNNCTSLESIDFTNLDTSKLENLDYCFYKAGGVVDLSQLNVSNVKSMKGTFESSAVSLDGIENWNVSNVTNMDSMFYECSTETINLDLRSWDVSNVRFMSGMFYSISSKNINLNLSGWNIANVIDTNYMFSDIGYNATSVSLDLSNWNTVNITNMSQMFRTQKSLFAASSASSNGQSWRLNVSGWNTSNVTNMRDMFSAAGQKASSWSIVGLNDWNTANVTDMASMFSYAGENATSWSVGDLSNWNTSNVTDMNQMFYYAGRDATSVNLGNLSNWDISKVTSFNQTFSHCTNLQNVTPSTFGNITKLDVGMFSGVETLTAVTIPNSVQYVGSFCFENCSNLASVKIRGTSYTDKAAARQALTDNSIYASADSDMIGSNIFNGTAMTGEDEAICIIDGTMVTLADGTNVPVEDLKETDEVLVWNQGTGEYDTASLYCIDHKDLPKQEREVTILTFDDGTEVSCVGEQGFFDADLCEYVYLTQNSQEYIGHEFVKRDTNAELEENKWTTVKLAKIKTETKECKIYSPVSASHLCHYANDMLTMPGNLGGYFNLFEVDKDTLKINEEKYNADVQRYGLMSFEEFGGLINKETYDAINAKYLKVALGKGLLTWEKMVSRTESYSQYAQ